MRGKEANKQISSLIFFGFLIRTSSMFSEKGSPKTAKQDIEHLAKHARVTKIEEGMIHLGKGFMPGPRDVICARGKVAPNHTGNCRYQVVLEMNLQKYSNAKTRIEKSFIVSSIVELIREGSPNGGFVKQEKGEWYEVGNYLARQKVGKNLRELTSKKTYRQSRRQKIWDREFETPIMVPKIAIAVATSDHVNKLAST